MKPGQPLPESTLARLLRHAAEWWRQGDHASYFDAMNRATRLDPGNHGIVVDLGTAHAKCHDYAAAQQCFERAVSIATNKTEALEMIALQCRNLNRYDLAARFLERAAGRKEVSADTLTKLAEMQERLRRHDDARKWVERALRLDPANSLARLVRARLERTAGRLEEGERTIRTILDRSDADSWSTRIRGWYELGANLDRQGRYDEAMSACLAAKAMIRPNAAQAMAAQRLTQARLREAQQEITAEVLARWAHALPPSDGPADRLAVICGHPRSGTTLLEQVLDSHPGAISAEETPIFYETYLTLSRLLPPDAGLLAVLDSTPAPALRQARERYLHGLRMFTGPGSAGRLLIDKNPSLTGLVPAIMRFIPQTRFVTALRDPRDVCLSCFLQPLPLNPVSSSYLSLEETAVEYASLMGFWHALAPLLPVPALEVRYEDVVRDLEGASRRVLAYLSLDWDARVLRFDEHARAKLVRSPTYTEVARPISSGAIGRWRHYQKYMEPCLEKLAPLVRAFGYSE